MMDNCTDKKKLLIFGYGLPVVFTLLGVRSLLRHGWGIFPCILFAVALFVIALALFNREGLRAVYFNWMKAAHFIGNIVTAIIMAAVFFLIFAPIGIFLRIIGKDLLDRKLNRDANSYWHTREQILFDKDHYLRQF